MKKYKFSLESLLRLRISLEKKSQAELGKVNQEIYRFESQKSQDLADIGDVIDSQNKWLETGAQVCEIQYIPEFIASKRNNILILEKHLAHLYELRLQKMQELNKRRGEVEVIEKLKEKSRKMFLKERNKKENKDLDEQVRMWLGLREVK